MTETSRVTTPIENRTRRSGRVSKRLTRRLRPGETAYAAIDLGTNNCRLLVAAPSVRGFRIVDAFSRIVRLGEGVAKSGQLTHEAMDRTIDALQVCASKINRYPKLRIRSVATEACRTARNCDAFLHQVKEGTGLSLEIISAEEEARLAMRGCMSLLDSRYPSALTIDIGGGSTEIIWSPDAHSRDDEPDIHVLSLPIGVVNVAERYGHDQFDASGFEAMVSELGELLAHFEDSYQIRRAIEADRVQMIGSSGTVTTLTSVHLGLRHYSRSRVDGCHLRFDDLHRIGRNLVALDCQRRAEIACIGADRADLVVGGIAILEAICRMWPVGRLRVADRGLREGMLLGMMAEDACHRAENIH